MLPNRANDSFVDGHHHARPECSFLLDRTSANEFVAVEPVIFRVSSNDSLAIIEFIGFEAVNGQDDYVGPLLIDSVFGRQEVANIACIVTVNRFFKAIQFHKFFLK